jgi:hypothetical protein
MTERAHMDFYDVVLKPDPSRTVVRPFEPGYPKGFDTGRTRTACGYGSDGPTVIDESSAEALSRTLSAAEADLGPKDRLKFEAALSEFKARTFAKVDFRLEYQRMLREGLVGLTAPRVVDQFNRDVDRVGGQGADAVFDAKRVLAAKSARQIIVPTDDVRRRYRSIAPRVDIQAPFLGPHFRPFVHLVGPQFLGG